MQFLSNELTTIVQISLVVAVDITAGNQDPWRCRGNVDFCSSDTLRAIYGNLHRIVHGPTGMIPHRRKVPARSVGVKSSQVQGCEYVAVGEASRFGFPRSCPDRPSIM